MKRLLALTLALPAFGQLTADQKVFDFQALAGLYAKQYAPYDWKKQVYKFDLMSIGPFLDQVKNTTNDLDFYEVMAGYVSSLNDGHDFYVLPSTFEAWLGFSVDIYDGKFLIDYVDRRQLPLRRFPFDIGDELVSIDGTSASDLTTSFMKYDGWGNVRATRRNAAQYLTDRPQAILPHAVTLGDSAVIVVNRAATGATETYTIPWAKAGLPLTQVGPVPSPKMAFHQMRGTVPRRGRAPVAAAPRRAADPLSILQTSVRRPVLAVKALGDTAPVFQLPDGFTTRLGGSSNDYFYSGTYTASNLTIGYIRIPDFEPTDSSGNTQLSSALSQFQKEIAYFQANTDGLIVDVMRNGGGVGCYAEQLAANLIPTPFHIIEHQVRATYGFLSEFDYYQEYYQANGPQSTADQYQAIVDSLKTAYAANRGLSDPVPLCTLSADRQPAKDRAGNVIAYTKPLILLTDEFSASAAEIFAAILQDAKRGAVVGWRTAGMGGSDGTTGNIDQPVGVYSEGSTAVTVTLMVRNQDVQTPDFPTTRYIENVGVRPDVTIDYMTADNLTNNGKAFVQSMTDAIVQQIAKGQ